MDWKWTFWTVVAAYLLLYAGFGINESDGGFMTGNAWQWLCGKPLYSEVLYVRPPVSVWLRALEIRLLPEQWQLLGERWLFFLRVATYSWLCADVLYRGQRWVLATFIFVMSVHCYPPAGFYTFDGLFFSVLAVWCFHRSLWWAAGAAAVLAAFCKQSFYLTPALILGMSVVPRDARVVVKVGLAQIIAGSVLAGYLLWTGSWFHMIRQVSGATKLSMLWEQGFINLFKINPLVVVVGVVCLLLYVKKIPCFASFPQQKTWALLGLIVGLTATYIAQLWHRQTFTVPVSQSRILFWIAVGWAVYQMVYRKQWRENLFFVALLSLSWACTLSWGYSFPLQLAAPWVYVLFKGLEENAPPALKKGGSLAILLLVLLTFRWGYEFPYRDGRRSEMLHHIGSIFPKARGIFSDAETFDKYMEIKVLWEKFDGGKVVMPWFCQAHFLMDECPVLPAEWFAHREINSDTTLLLNLLQQKQPTVFLEKSLFPLILSDPEHSISQHIFYHWQPVAEGQFYRVYQCPVKH